jgi:hypothetical protein
MNADCFWEPLLHIGAGNHCLFIINGVLFNRSGCLWTIKEMSHALWSFHFLYKSLTLILKLNPCEKDGNSKDIMDVQLISHATGE